MPALQLNGPDLLNAVRRLPPKELDAFLDQALLLRHRPRSNTLTAAESRLIKRINRGLSLSLTRRYAHLSRKRKRGVLTGAEREELLQLTHEAEMCDADRAAALLELAKLRRAPVRLLMKQMGIQPAPIDG